MTVTPENAPVPKAPPDPAPAPSGEKQVLGEVQRLADRVRALEGADLEIPEGAPKAPCASWSPLDVSTWG